MEITPKRSLSLNSELANNYFGITSPFGMSKKMWTAQSMKPSNPSASPGCRMNHSLSMDDTRINHQNFEKKPDNSFFKGMHWMLGSLSNIVSKIPAFVSNINNPLSVTVVGNQGILFPELKDDIKIIGESSVYTSNTNIAGIYTERDLLANNWIEDLSQVQESDDLNRAIQESLKQLKAQPKLQDEEKLKKGVDEIDFTPSISEKIKETYQNFEENFQKLRNLQNSQENCQKVQSIEKSPENLPRSPTTERREKSPSPDIVKIHENNLKNLEETENPRTSEDMVTTSVPCSSTRSKFIPSKMDSIDCDIPAKRPHLLKTRKKTNVVARSRGKTKSKYQLRKSGVSQLKHRKERTKQNLYSNIQDDLDTWEMEENNDSSEESPRSPEDCQSTVLHRPDYPTFIDSYVIGKCKTKQRKRNEPVWRVRFCPESPQEVISSISCGFRQRLLSASSMDSEDSCSIVFEDRDEYSESSSDSDDYDETSSEEEDTEDEDDEEGTIQKVRFNLEPTVHTMIQWDYAYRAARRGPWEQMARDRDRFRGRIHCTGRILDPILTAKHRECIWHDRFDESVSKLENVENSME